MLCHSVVPQQIANVDVNRTLLTIEWSVPSSDCTIQHYQVDYRVGIVFMPYIKPKILSCGRRRSKTS